MERGGGAQRLSRLKTLFGISKGGAQGASPLNPLVSKSLVPDKCFGEISGEYQRPHKKHLVPSQTVTPRNNNKKTNHGWVLVRVGLGPTLANKIRCLSVESTGRVYRLTSLGPPQVGAFHLDSFQLSPTGPWAPLFRSI